MRVPRLGLAQMIIEQALGDRFQFAENIRIGQRIEKFSLEFWDGQEWKTITGGTTVGYKRLLRFDPVTANKVRLRIESSRLSPTLAEFGLYKQPG